MTFYMRWTIILIMMLVIFCEYLYDQSLISFVWFACHPRPQINLRRRKGNCERDCEPVIYTNKWYIVGAMFSNYKLFPYSHPFLNCISDTNFDFNQIYIFTFKTFKPHTKSVIKHLFLEQILDSHNKYNKIDHRILLF